MIQSLNQPEPGSSPSKRSILIQWDILEAAQLIPAGLDQEEFAKQYEACWEKSVWVGGVQLNEEVCRFTSSLFETTDAEQSKKCENDLFVALLKALAVKLNPEKK